MKPITRGAGINASERYLAKLADATFLDLWSYPNTFGDRTVNGRKTGKELCDLLVVCGDDVLVFSDKAINWPGGEDVHLAWSRWYRSAVESSVKQIRGAERWIRHHPNRIFIDSKCEIPLPIQLPPADRMRVHGIAVAVGAHDACSEYVGDPDGSLLVRSCLQGSAHVTPAHADYAPFAIGDVDPTGPFVHVFDETALDLVMAEMDTVTDFVWYLNARQVAIRDRIVALAAGEAEMLAAYLETEDAEGRHSFPSAASFGGQLTDGLFINGGEYTRYLMSRACEAKTSANRVSYGWDRLIQTFTRNVLGGTSVAIFGEVPEVALAERGLRMMALEDRTRRRALSEAFFGAIDEAVRANQDRFARVILPIGPSPDPLCGHVFLIFPFRGVAAEKGYDAYRRLRSTFLHAYCLVALYENRGLSRMLGIALDGPMSLSGRQGGSEDLMLFEVTEWTADLENDAVRMKADLEILVADRLRAGRATTYEYPPSPEDTETVGNRRDRRATRSKMRRGR